LPVKTQFFRACWGFYPLAILPTVETVGYCRSRLRRWEGRIVGHPKIFENLCGAFAFI
jgi:hypothetical protein